MIQSPRRFRALLPRRKSMASRENFGWHGQAQLARVFFPGTHGQIPMYIGTHATRPRIIRNHIDESTIAANLFRPVFQA